MYRVNTVVKLLAWVMMAVFLATAASAAEKAPVRPLMLYFYNPTCRLCTKTNEVVASAEEKYKDAMEFQRLNIADADSGADNVMYMFELLDEMQVPEGDNITLVVVLGLLEEINGEVMFAPKRVLVEGEEIIAKLLPEIADFLQKEGKGGAPLGMNRPVSFFLEQRPSLVASR